MTMMTDDERHRLTQQVQALKQLLQPLNALVNTTGHVLAAVDTAQREVEASRAAVERDQALIAARAGDLEQARALTGTITYLTREVAALEAKRDQLVADMDAIRELARQAAAVA